jgi:hypothetical protein
MTPLMTDAPVHIHADLDMDTEGVGILWRPTGTGVTAVTTGDWGRSWTVVPGERWAFAGVATARTIWTASLTCGSRADLVCPVDVDVSTDAGARWAVHRMSGAVIKVPGTGVGGSLSDTGTGVGYLHVPGFLIATTDGWMEADVDRQLRLVQGHNGDIAACNPWAQRRLGTLPHLRRRMVAVPLRRRWSHLVGEDHRKRTGCRDAVGGCHGRRRRVGDVDDLHHDL